MVSRSTASTRPFTRAQMRAMAKGDGRVVGFQDGGLFFKIYNIPKSRPNPYPILNVGML